MRAISTINDISNACKISKIRLAKDTFSYLEILFCQRIALIARHTIPKPYNTKFTENIQDSPFHRKALQVLKAYIFPRQILFLRQISIYLDTPSRACNLKAHAIVTRTKLTNQQSWLGGIQK